MTPAQIAAWDVATPEQRVLWLMSSAHLAAWVRLPRARQIELIAAWCEIPQGPFGAPESWYRIGMKPF
jgi:hypothetical protein